jgi:hypothetical protein
MALSKRLGFCFLLQVAAVAALGCGGDDSNDKSEAGNAASDGQAIPSGGTLELSPAIAHTGYDGEHDFVVHIKVASVKPQSWRCSDPSAVSFMPTEDGVLVTTRKAGEFTITAIAGSNNGAAKLKVASYDKGDWVYGKERYNNGVAALTLPDGGPITGPDDDDEGIDESEDGDFDPGTIMFDKNSACSFCHGDTSALHVKHTPTQIAQYSDEQVLAIFTMGMKPPGATMRIFPSDGVWKEIHQWKMSEAEKKGILVYLRSLAPREQDPIQFPGPGGGAASMDGGLP